MEAILERLKKEPSQVLIGRYLALVAELRDEREKQEQTLRLASALVKSKPAEALRIAHMAHRADRTDPRPLDVMIASFEARGRYAKAEVLKIERAKLEKANATEMMPGGKKQHVADDLMSDAAALAAVDPMPPVQGLPAGAPRLPQGRGGPKIVFSTEGVDGDGGAREETKMAELDLGGDAPPPEYSALAMLFHDAEDKASEPVRAPAHAPEAAVELPWREPERSPIHSSAPVVANDKQNNVYDPSPADDGLTAVLSALPVGQGPLGAASSREASGRSSAPAGGRAAAAAVRGRDTGGSEAPAQRGAPEGGAAVFSSLPQSAVIAGAAAQVPMRDTSAAAALFDHYWRAGRFDEARDLMHQTAAACAHEPWWQGRRAALELADAQGLLDKTKTEELPPAKLRPADVPPEERVPMTGDPFWQPLYAELNRLAKAGLVPPSASLAEADKLAEALARHPLAATLSKPFLAALAGIAGPHKGGPSGKLRSLYWDLFQGLWGTAPDASCAKALETIELTRLDPGFLGLYLDALIASGRSRRALAFARETLEVNPHLAWARVIARRLEPIAKALGTEAVTWHEDEGVAALNERLAARAKPKLAFCLAVGA